MLINGSGLASQQSLAIEESYTYYALLPQILPHWRPPKGVKIMFNHLTSRLQGTLDKLRGVGRITEDNVKEFHEEAPRGP